MRTALAALLVSILIVGVAETAGAHGGTAPPVPPPPRRIPNPTPPSSPDDNTPRSPRDVGPTPPGAGGPATPGGRGVAKGPSRDSWSWWWMLNGEEILDERAAVRRRNALDATPDAERAKKAALARELERGRVVAACRALLADREEDPDVRSAAAIALARCGDLADVHLLMRLASDKGEETLVEESSALALGILEVRIPEVRDLLVSILDDRKVRARTRCFAALALGLLRDESDEAFDCLVRRLDGSEELADVPICALAAIGLVGDPDRAPVLLRWLGEERIGTRRIRDLERSHVVLALGATGDPAVLPAISRCLRERGNLTRRSAMIALGRVLPWAPEERLRMTKALAAHLSSERDEAAANLGAIALGRIGGAPEAEAETRKVATGALLARARAGRAESRAFAALALALLGSGTEPGSEVRYVLAGEIRKGLVAGKLPPSVRMAFCLSLGLLGDPDAVPVLAAILADKGTDPGLRATAAVSLGLVGHPASLARVLAALEEEKDRQVRVSCAAAAARLGGWRAVRFLLEEIADPKASRYAAGSAILALGRIGDRRAIDPLLGLVLPEKGKPRASPLLRGLAVVALGRIAGREDVTVLRRISRDLNVHAMVPALEEAVTIH